MMNIHTVLYTILNWMDRGGIGILDLDTKLCIKDLEFLRNNLKLIVTETENGTKIQYK